MSRPCPCCQVVITTSCPECGWPACSCTKEMRAEWERDRMLEWVWEKLDEVRAADPNRR